MICGGCRVERANNLVPAAREPSHNAESAPALARYLLELAWGSGVIAKSDLGIVGCEAVHGS